MRYLGLACGLVVCLGAAAVGPLWAQDGDDPIACPAMACRDVDCLAGIPEDDPCRKYYEAGCTEPGPTPPPTECELRLAELYALIDQTLQDPVCAGALEEPPVTETPEPGQEEPGVYGPSEDAAASGPKGGKKLILGEKNRAKAQRKLCRGKRRHRN